MKLVFVHGRDQQGKVRADLQRVWEEALDVGLANAGLPRPQGMSVAFPYYGDELERLVKALGTPLVADVRTRGDNPDTAEADFRGRLLAELAAGAGISELAIAEQLGGLPAEKGPLNWPWVQAILRALDRTPLGEASIDAFTRDVYVYLTNDVVGRTIDKLVVDAIGDEPSVVVAHSLGSIVTYRSLRQLGARANVRRFITVGSPLGVTAIREHLLPPALARPEGVSAWFNAFDRRDVVALRPLDRGTWDIDPPIENRSTVDNHTDNRHGISGYLDDPVIARWIAEGLSE
ncbi:hypothetical protein [Methylibium sp.]|uniref:hypothetical protein n=1 Tax=Methylibium sp. TaxID=2067992 RepID=UPI003D134AC0